MNNSLDYYFAIYLLFLNDSDSRKSILLQQIFKCQNVDEYEQESEEYSKMRNKSWSTVRNSLDLQEVMDDALEQYHQRHENELYVALLTLVVALNEELRHKAILVEDLLKLNVDGINVFKCVLLGMRIIASTALRRIQFSLCLQVMLEFYPYLGSNISSYLNPEALKHLSLVIIDGLVDQSHDDDQQQAINLLIALLSQLDAASAKYMLDKIENEYNIKFKRNYAFINILQRYAKKAKGQLAAFYNESALYLYLLCKSRGIEIGWKIGVVDEGLFERLDDVAYVNRYRTGECYIPHTLLMQYALSTYLYCETIHLQTDLLSSITEDIDRAPEQIADVHEGVLEAQAKYADDLIVLYNIQEKEFTHFEIVNVQRVKQGYKCMAAVEDGRYEWFEIHGSISTHLRTLNLLKQVLVSEINSGTLSKELLEEQHQPALEALDQGGKKLKRNGIRKIPILAFSKYNTINQTYHILATSLSWSKKEGYLQLDEEQHSITCNGHCYCYNDTLAQEIMPLNASQLACLLHIHSEDILFVVGAPGTGKSYTASAIVRSFLLDENSHFVVEDKWKESKAISYFKWAFPNISLYCEYLGFLRVKPQLHQIIVTAHSNNATDQMAESLLSDGFPLKRPFILRLGSSSTNENLLQFTVEGYIQLFWQDLVKYELVEPKSEVTLNDLYQELSKHSEFFDILYAFKSRVSLTDALMKNADVIAATMNYLQSNVSNIRSNPILIIEEAARVAEYNIASLLPLAPYKMLLIGDVMQLPPVIKDPELNTKAGLTESYFHKSVFRGKSVIVLDTQMRVHTSICNLYRKIYSERLPDNIALTNGLVDFVKQNGNSVFGYEFVGECKDEVNSKECAIVHKIYQQLQLEHKSDKISVLAIYKKQALALSRLLQTKTFTVDEYQGLENDVIIVSLTTVEPSKFADDLNRALVAFSRGRKELHIVGNIQAFNNDIFKKVKQLAQISVVK